jgi:16S rRNA (uracil1498-N3)-methyltransferase
MRTPRIFQDIPLAALQTFTLSEQAARHLIAVLRCKQGDKLVVFNGDGCEHPAIISSVKHHSIDVEVVEKVEKNLESPLLLHLGQAISKGDRMDYTLQKATELGVAFITPLFSTRSEVHLKGERLEKKMNHWRKVITSACEQCGRNKIPTLFTPQMLSFWIREREENTKFVMDHRETLGLQTSMGSTSIALLVGPEGGLTLQEKEEAMNQGFKGLRLGPRVLRTETAGVAAISILQFWAGDMA